MSVNGFIRSVRFQRHTRLFCWLPMGRGICVPRGSVLLLLVEPRVARSRRGASHILYVRRGSDGAFAGTDVIRSESERAHLSHQVVPP